MSHPRQAGEGPAQSQTPEELDAGEYCRRVEQHLTRVNGGHLVRIVGPAFELVRGWADAGVPLSVVIHGINLKAERHKSGQATRPLRLEFCEGDIRAVYADWRRAILPALGLMTPARDAVAGGSEAAATESDDNKPGSMTKHLNRAVELLGRVAGRLDLSDGFRDAVQSVLDEVVVLREQVKGRRGEARDEASRAIADRLPIMDRTLIAAARGAVSDMELRTMTTEAARELSAYRARLTPEAWQRSIELTVDRFLRDRLTLPILVL